ncbi:MAG TPA: serine/threonine-protein kinase [Lacipirellulaceae bacterium]
MDKVVGKCDDVQLERLLHSDDEESDEVRAAAKHLESCEACRSRLASFAADASWWNDARESLSSSDAFAWKPDLTRSAAFAGREGSRGDSIQSDVRRILGAPNHPENLGRLGRYDIERIIGSGGMGIVLKAHDSELNRPIAIKVLAAHLAHVGAARDRFSREARAAAAVVHEHVVAIYNVETDGHTPFLVMQYVPGRSLQARVDEDGPLTVEEVLRIGMQAAAGLAAAHAQGLVHRDVKPSNILLEETVERAVLTDFGLARAINDASLTQTGVLAGTPFYMSPEQATGEAIDHRSDLFSLGSVLYFMATGHPPFRAEGALAVLHRICREPHRPVWQLNQSVPDEVSEVIDTLLEKKPGRRYASAEEVRERLASLLSRAQQFGFGRRRFARIRGKRLRRRVLWSAVAGLLVAAAVVGVVATWPASRPQATEQPPAHPAADGAEIARSEREFAGEWKESAHAIGQMERPTSFLSSGDSWNRDLESLKQSLANLEALVNPAAKPEGERK